jgi:hypothetical protein
MNLQRTVQEFICTSNKFVTLSVHFIFKEMLQMVLLDRSEVRTILLNVYF